MPVHQFSEYVPQTLYPYPIEDCERTQNHAERERNTKDIARQALLGQIQYNHMKKAVEKEQDVRFGKKMIKDAHDSLHGEGAFLQAKKQ